MKTAGYDIVLLLNDDFLNQVSGAMFYNNFLTFNGKKDLGEKLTPSQSGSIPASLRGMLKVGYRFKLLYEPFIGFVKDEECENRNECKIMLSAKLRVYLWILEGLEVKFDASITTTTVAKMEDNLFCIYLDKTDRTELTIDYHSENDGTVKIELDTLFNSAMADYFQKNKTVFKIEIPGISPNLPYVDRKCDKDVDKCTFPTGVICTRNTGEECTIPVEIKAMKTTGSALLVAANFFGFEGGDPGRLKEFARNCNVGVAISEFAMKNVFDFYWDKTSWNKSFHKSKSFKIDMVDKALDMVIDLTNFILHPAVKIATGGFVDAKTEFISSDFIYSLDINFKTKPTFDFENGNKITIYDLGVGIDVRLKMYVTLESTLKAGPVVPVPEDCTPWEDSFVLSRDRKTLVVIDLFVPIENLNLKKCTGELSINEEKKNLQAIVTDIDLDTFDYIKADCLFNKLPLDIQTDIIDGMKEKLIEAIPPIVVSPVIFRLDIKLIPWKVNIEGRKFSTTHSEAVVGAYLHFNEMRKKLHPVPKYICNFNNMEVHRAGCDSILDTYETHQDGYYLLKDALKKNYDGCKKCLPGFHKR